MHHVPHGVMKLKKEEFKDLKQSSMTVSEYLIRFTQLSCYAPDYMDIDEKKQYWFLNRMNDGLICALEAHNFQDMLDKTLVLENRSRIMQHKRKIQCTGTQGSNKRFHDGSSSQGPVFHSSQ
jgi:hypothetical protein